MRISECAYSVNAEDIYTLLLRAGDVKPGLERELVARTPDGHSSTFRATVCANAIWRDGRVFLTCYGCGNRCTRLYSPLEASPLRCLQCWGLTYGSRSFRNYKDSGPRWFRGLGTHRDFAHQDAERVREQRRQAARQRWAERREIRASLARTEQSEKTRKTEKA